MVILDADHSSLDRNLRPGGVAEFQEARPGWRSDDHSVPKGGYIEKYTRSFFTACTKAGLRDAAPEIPHLMEEAGFTDVRVIFKKMPIGYWPKEPEMKVCVLLQIARYAKNAVPRGAIAVTRG